MRRLWLVLIEPIKKRNFRKLRSYTISSNPSNSVRIFYFGLYIISNEYLADGLDAESS